MVRIDARACHRSPVAMSTASMSVRWARNSRISGYTAQSELPYRWSTVCLTFSREARWASQMATNCTSFSGSIHRRSLMPRPRRPIPPATMRSLGSTAPSRPSADVGMTAGAASAAPATAAVLRNPRRVSVAGGESFV